MNVMPRRELLALLTLSLFAAGCGGSTLPKGETGSVSGSVKYNGQPVPAGCTVLFMGPNGITGSGVTDSSGNYSILMRDGSKVLVGSYRVSVTPPAPPPLSDEEAMNLSMSGKPTVPPGDKEVPAKYRSPESSPLTFDVKTGANTFDIPLAD